MKKISSMIVVPVMFAMLLQPVFAGEKISGPSTASASSRKAAPANIETMQREMEHILRRITDMEEEMRQLRQAYSYLHLQPRPSGIQERQQQYFWRLEQKIQQLEMQIMQLRKNQYGQ